MLRCISSAARGVKQPFLRKKICRIRCWTRHVSLGFSMEVFSGSYHKSQVLQGTLKPDLVFSKGGYVSVPVCLAAKRMKIPIILHESDAVMGRANRLIAKLSTKICLGFPDSRRTISPLTTHHLRIHRQSSPSRNHPRLPRRRPPPV